MQLGCRQNVITNGGNQQSEQLAGCADPAGQRRAIQIDAFAGADVGLPVERLMIGVVRHQHMSQQSGSGEPAINGPRRCRRLHDPVTGIAAQLRTHMAQHLEAGPDVLQHLGYVFAQLAEPAAAVGAGLMTRHMGVNFARKMLWQGTATRLRRCWAALRELPPWVSSTALAACRSSN